MMKVVNNLALFSSRIVVIALILMVLPALNLPGFGKFLNTQVSANSDIEGYIFIDNNGNGNYDAGTDTPQDNIVVTTYRWQDPGPPKTSGPADSIPAAGKTYYMTTSSNNPSYRGFFCSNSNTQVAEGKNCPHSPDPIGTGGEVDLSYMYRNSFPIPNGYYISSWKAICYTGSSKTTPLTTCGMWTFSGGYPYPQNTAGGSGYTTSTISWNPWPNPNPNALDFWLNPQNQRVNFQIALKPRPPEPPHITYDTSACTASGYNAYATMHWSAVQYASYYEIYRDGTAAINKIAGPIYTTAYTDFVGLEGEWHWYKVKAVGAGGETWSDNDTGLQQSAYCQRNATCVGYSANMGEQFTINQTKNVTLTMSNPNPGISRAWLAGTSNPYKLGSQDPQNNLRWGLNRVGLASDVNPGGNKAFNFNVTAPSTPGTYSNKWQMLQEGISPGFGDTCGPAAVIVTLPPPIVSALQIQPIFAGDAALCSGSGGIIGGVFNPMRIYLTATNATKYYVAFYNQAGGQALDLNTIKARLNANPKEGFILAYGKIVAEDLVDKYYVYNPTTQTWYDISSYADTGSGYPINSGSYEIYRVFNSSIYGTPAWKISLSNDFGDKDMFTAVQAENDANTDTDFQADHAVSCLPM